MSVNSDTSPSVPRLDDETEHAIAAVLISQNSVSGAVRLTDDWREKKIVRDRRVAALRSRIRTLVREAESHGAEQVCRMIQIAEDFG